MSFDVDVAIVGGGPAGSTTALHLVRREGIEPSRIRVLDKARFPREKPCAGAVSAWGVEALAAVGVAVTVPHVVMEGLRVLDGAARGEGARGREPLGVVVRRDEFDASLLDAARGDGVDVRDGEGLVALERTRGGFRLATSRGSFTAALVVAADGAGSLVRKLEGLREPARKGHLYVLETDERPGDVGTRAGLCDFDLGPSADGLQGYYWDFPTIIGGTRMVSRGIYHANLAPGGAVKDVLHRYLRARGLDPATTRLKPFSTRPFVAGTILETPGVAFVGESAGIDATTGEGIAQAILMARLGAAHVARALRLRSSDLSGYGRAVVRARVGRHLLQSAWLAERVYGPKGAPWRAFLARSPRAREAGAQWYGGRPLGVATKARLAVGLAGELAASALG